MGHYIVSNNSLTSIAEAIRGKSGNNQPLTYPQDFINEINNLSACKVISDTTENWNNDITYVPAAGDIIVYIDKANVIENNETKYIPGIKIGDGNAYCVDLPFVADDIAISLLDHINDNIRHITAQERHFWNNKLNITIHGEELQFTRN